MQTPTSISNPSPRAEAFSRELIDLVRRHRERDPSCGLPDVLVALELAKASLLAEAGMTGVRRAIFAVVAAILAAATAFVFLAASP